MKKITSISMSIALSLLLTACASMNKEECTDANWQSIGAKDGQKGLKLEKFTKRQKQCSKFGVAAEESNYMLGYNIGLERYCSPYGGLLAGESGKKYKNVCPIELETTFLPPYEKAREHYKAKSNAELRMDSYHDLIEEIDNRTEDIDDKKAQLPSITNKAEYNELVRDINKLIKKNNKRRRNVSFSRSGARSAEQAFSRIDASYQLYRFDFIKQHPSFTSAKK